jgi:hypothetical protein
VLDPDGFSKDETYAPTASIARMSNEEFSVALSRPEFGHIMSLHSLQRVPKNDALGYLIKMRQVIKPDGILHLAVPSLEWGCRQILTDKPSPAVLVHMYGMQDKPENYFASGWTMRLLRRFLARAGWKVQEARREEYTISINAVDITADQHYLEAVPTEARDEPEEAVE